MGIKLEIIAFSIEACRLAADSGADRIELCDNPGEGGTTPSAGLIRLALANLAIPVFPIIRPRGGDFLYTNLEFEVMADDIRLCRDSGCQGVVIGLLRPDGTVDTERTSRLVELAHPMDVTFHRAFDRVSDPFSSLEDIIHCGCKRILTSGCKPTAAEGLSLIRALHTQARDRITIMPGSGIRAANIAHIVLQTGVREVHSSASSRKESSMRYINPLMNEDLSQTLPASDEIFRMRAAINEWQSTP